MKERFVGHNGASAEQIPSANGETPVVLDTSLISPEPESIVEMPNKRERAISLVAQENMARHLDNRSRLHGVYYRGTYYHYGVGQPRRKNGK